MDKNCEKHKKAPNNDQEINICKKKKRNTLMCWHLAENVNSFLFFFLLNLLFNGKREEIVNF